MHHLGTLLIETERLILRRFEVSDAEAVYHNWTKDYEVTKYLTWPTHNSLEITKRVLEDWINNYSDSRFYQWAIVLKGHSDKPIGSISVVHIKEDLDIMEIGYCIGREYWNQGITSEAFQGVIKFLFEQVEVKRIEARHDPRNPNSGKVMLKCGLQYEGTLRNADRNNQGICDTAMYGILSEDYFSKRK